MALVVWPGLARVGLGCLPFRRRHWRPPKWRNISSRKWQHNCLAKLLPHLASQQQSATAAHATLASCNYSKRTPLAVLFSFCFILFCFALFVYVFIFVSCNFCHSHSGQTWPGNLILKACQTACCCCKQLFHLACCGRKLMYFFATFCYSFSRERKRIKYYALRLLARHVTPSWG